MSVFSDNLKRFRLLAGFSSMKALADAAGLVYNTYLSYETKDVEPKYAILCKLADLLHVTTDELLGHTFASDPFMADIKKAAAAAASAAAAALGMPAPKLDAADDLRFQELRKIMAEVSFAITKDPDSPPDPKFGERILITVDDWGCKNTTFDYFYRMYLLIPRIWQGEQHGAYIQLKRKLLLRYGGRRRHDDFLDEDDVLLGYYERLFEMEIASKSPEEIRAIVEGRAENPLLHPLESELRGANHAK